MRRKLKFIAQQHFLCRTFVLTPLQTTKWEVNCDENNKEEKYSTQTFINWQLTCINSSSSRCNITEHQSGNKYLITTLYLSKKPFIKSWCYTIINFNPVCCKEACIELYLLLGDMNFSEEPLVPNSNKLL